MKNVSFIRGTVELLGIVLLRFPALQRMWAASLITVNLAGLYFIGRLEAQVVVATNLIAISSMVVIYRKIGFTRILGVAHILWIPMFIWMATRLDAMEADPALMVWFWALVSVNALSLVIDAIDAVRFLRGERQPHYHWETPAAAQEPMAR